MHTMEDGISFGLILPENAKDVADFLLSNFFPNEPISRALELPPNQVQRWFTPTIIGSVQQECCIQAIDIKTGQIVGVAINILVEKNLQEPESVGEGRGLLDLLDVTEPVMVEIAKFLGFLNQVPMQVYKPGMDTDGRVRTVNCVYLNVLPAYCGKGIGKTLVDKSEVIAREKNAAYMQVDTTSEFSYRIFNRCGFSVIREIPLAGHLRNIESIDNGVHKQGRILLKKIRP
ncbi:uncharacterized protein LOC110844956 [Folsomia candida]|uniref:Dopamine N-acetyltransferase n=1 Tax=Folsomia candida TaxID=158441 RepID=A0A226EML9_FOLCA|nr:uncharacterized protein LOC110844956 [Folsomia candida]OXA58882.1 Dopamine N-acetyltransferase [Folsomia candida]